jgi:hypothetical protein
MHIPNQIKLKYSLDRTLYDHKTILCKKQASNNSRKRLTGETKERFQPWFLLVGLVLEYYGELEFSVFM